jgi:hypothetical protein
MIWIFCTGFSNYDTVDLLVKISSPRKLQLLSWAYAASYNKTLYYLISCLKGFTLHSKILCRYHAADKKKLNSVGLWAIKCISTIPVSIYPLWADSTQNTIWHTHTHTHTHTQRTPKAHRSSAAWTRVEICGTFGFQVFDLLGFCAGSLGYLLPTRCPDTAAANYPLTLKISQ